jgi:hypothetical protein
VLPLSDCNTKPNFLGPLDEADLKAMDPADKSFLFSPYDGSTASFRDVVFLNSRQ